LLKDRLTLVFKFFISVFSLYSISRATDITAIALMIGEINLKYVIVAAIIYWVAQIIGSLRCFYIARVLGKTLPLFISLKAHFIGLWFNQIMPTSLGGDLIKVAILKKSIGLTVAIKAAILDRFSGLFVLMLSIGILLPVYDQIIPTDKRNLLEGLRVISLGFVFSVITFVWLSGKLSGNFKKYFFISQITQFVSNIALFKKGKSLWEQAWTSTAVHFSGVASYILLSVALGYEVNILTYMLIVPLVFLVALLPISFAGWGVREMGAVWLFGMVGMSEERALLLSISYGVMLLLCGLPGLIWFLYNRNSNTLNMHKA
jgi:uncharacterized protein (TIRG00374 family)